MTKRDKAERLAAQAQTAWHMAEQGTRLAVVADKFYVTRDYVWKLLELHQRKRRARR